MGDSKGKLGLFTKHFSSGVTTILIFVCITLTNTWRMSHETKNDVTDIKRDLKEGTSERFKRSDAEAHAKVQDERMRELER